MHEQLKQWLSVGDCRPESVDVGSWDGSAMSAGAEGFKFSTDPQLDVKLRDVVDLYLPPEKPWSSA